MTKKLLIWPVQLSFFVTAHFSSVLKRKGVILCRFKAICSLVNMIDVPGVCPFVRSDGVYHRPKPKLQWCARAPLCWWHSFARRWPLAVCGEQRWTGQCLRLHLSTPLSKANQLQGVHHNSDCAITHSRCADADAGRFDGRTETKTKSSPSQDHCHPVQRRRHAAKRRIGNVGTTKCAKSFQAVRIDS